GFGLGGRDDRLGVQQRLELGAANYLRRRLQLQLVEAFQLKHGASSGATSNVRTRCTSRNAGWTPSSVRGATRRRSHFSGSLSATRSITAGGAPARQPPRARQPSPAACSGTSSASACGSSSAGNWRTRNAARLIANW